jgi:tight adherence protein C
MILYLIPFLTALTLLTAAAALIQYRTRSRQVADRLQRVVDDSVIAVPGDVMAEPSLPLALQPVAFLGWLMPGLIYNENLKWELARAGFRHVQARKAFAGLRVVCAAVLALSAFVVTSMWGRLPMEVAILSLVSAVLGFYAPLMVLRYQQVRRQEEITLALPDALDLLVICVEAGQGLNAALVKVSRECEFQSRALGDELRAANNEMLTGITRTQALRNLALRTGVDDVRALVAVMIQSDRFGTSIAQALRVHAQSLRTRRRQRAEETARKTPVKLVFPLVFCIFPELLVVILAPGLLKLYRALAGMSQG